MKDTLPTRAFSAEEVAALDAYTIEQMGVDLRQLMEIAGRDSADAAVRLFERCRNLRVAVLAGSGGNGGDALVCAKWLKLWGWNVTVILSRPREELKPVTVHQLEIWESFGGETLDTPPDEVCCIVDGLLGYSLEGDPHGKAAELIRWANSAPAPILALDLPSGLNATTGERAKPCIIADYTVVYGVLKKGLLVQEAKEYTGTLELIDIGFPREFPEELMS